jgi:hypothetical protein
LTQGVEALQETIIAIATDERERVFSPVKAPVPIATVEVLHVVCRLKHDHKLILLGYLLAEMNASSPWMRLLLRFTFSPV